MWIAEDLELVRIYYQRGNLKGSRLNYEVKDPPTSGWQNALIIRGDKRSTIFCPYTLQAWTVTNDAAELRDRKDFDWSHAEFEKTVALLQSNWDQYQKLAMQKDYDTAALIFKKLGVKAPEQKLKGGEVDTRKKGGKDASQKLRKPVKLQGKRGQFLKWFLEKGGSGSIREAMAEFGMSRSNVLSYLYMLKKDHGLGYDLVGDTANIQLPEGTENPFDEEWELDPLEM